MATSFLVPTASRDIGVRASGGKPLGHIKQAFVNEQKLDGPDEKDVDEMTQSYIPLALARAKMQVLSEELAAMKQKHLQIIDQVTQKYEALTHESRTHFEGVVDEVKARASLKLKENKALVEELRDELVTVQEQQALKNQQMRLEVKTAVKEQGRLQQELISREAEAKQLREQHEIDVANIEQRRGELDEMLRTRVAREEHDALLAEREGLSSKLDTETRAYEEKVQSLQSDVDLKHARLQELETEVQALRAQDEQAQQKLTQMESELAQARADLEESRTTLESASAANQSASEEAAAESAKQLTEAQDRLTEAEAKVSALEAQLLVAQASGGGGGGGGDGSGPPRIVTVPDPELQTKIRQLENELNKLGKENVELCKVITEREEAINGSNDLLAQIKKEAKESTVLGGAASAAASEEGGEDEPGEDVSEYEEVQTEEEVEEMVPTGAMISTGGGGATPPDEHATKRVELSALLQANESETNRLIGLVSGLEKDIKPKVLDYKTRLGEFKTDSERKELEVKLGYDHLVEEDGSEHELRPGDIRELEDMLEWTTTQAELKPILATKVSTLKENKKALEANKTKLADMKQEITTLKEQGGHDDEVVQKEKEFLALRTQMQADAMELKTTFAAYEGEKASFQEKEALLQKLYTKFKIDSEREEQDKPRKLGQDQRSQVERLVGLIKNKGKERDALKALAEEVNTQNARLKELRSERDQAQTKWNDTKSELEALPPPPTPSEGGGSSEPEMVLRKVKKPVTKRVKKPSRKVKRKPAAASASVVAGTGAPLIPVALLQQLKPISLPGSKGKYANRGEFTPVQPTTFKPAPTAAELGLSGGGGGGGGGSDPALQRNFDALQKKYRKVESELESLRSQTDQQRDVIQSKEAELEELRSQLKAMSEGDVDERVAALAQQLEAQRAEVGAQTQRHHAKLTELQAKVQEARDETGTVQDELTKLKSELKSTQDRLRSANARASSGGAAVAAAVSGGGEGGGMPGGVDPSIVAQLEQQRDDQAAQISELQTRIQELESEVASHSGSLEEQLARKEAELTEQHASKLSELETQLQENTEKLRITKKKAKELHEALTEETGKREGLEVTVQERDATIQSMEAITNEAKNSMDRLNGEIKKRDGIIETKQSEIQALEDRRAQLEKDVGFLEVRNFEEVKRRKEFQAKYEDAKGKVRVYARVRPFSKAEIAADEKTLLRPGTNEWTLCINETQKNYQGIVSDNWRPVEFDHVFHFGLDNTKPNASQAEVFEETKIFAELTVQGINCCVFAYGQSGTGKTFTMAGIRPKEENGMTTELLGLKPRMIQRVYEMKKELRKTHDIDISCYMLEIYLNKLEDVFWKLQTQQKYHGKEKSKWPEPPELKVRVDAKRKVTVDNSIICKFDTAEEMQTFCDDAEATRRVRKTGLNEESSRSHLIFAIICQSTDKKTGKKTTGKLSLVDLAGSERAEKTNVEGLTKAARAAMMEEGIAINESLRMLKSVFRILGEANKPLAKGQKAEIVQYRGNMLTELMQDSLGGNAKTLMFVNVGPAASNISETVDSLAYGDLVKNITNEKVSADADNEEQIRFLGAQVRAYEAKYGPLD